MARPTVELEETRREIRHSFALWNIDPSEFEILWDEERDSNRVIRKPGVKVRFMRNGQWQEIGCYDYPLRAQNLRQVFLLIERLRIAEQHGVQYQGLTFSRDVVVSNGQGRESSRKQDLLDAYDVLGVSLDDPIDLLKDIYRRKSASYHPDKGGDVNKFKRLTDAYNLILESRGAK